MFHLNVPLPYLGYWRVFQDTCSLPHCPASEWRWWVHVQTYMYMYPTTWSVRWHLLLATMYMYIYIHTCTCPAGKLVYNAQSPDEAALVSAARNFGYVFTVMIEQREWRIWRWYLSSSLGEKPIHHDCENTAQGRGRDRCEWSWSPTAVHYTLSYVCTYMYASLPVCIQSILICSAVSL